VAETPIEFAESAVKDLQAIRDWYAEEQVPQVGERLVTEIFDHIELLGVHPDLGRVVSEFDQVWLRELIHPPFRVVYKRESERIVVVRVWRSERLLELVDDA
jgi:plasmid stabilization system protein ParE